MSWSIGYDSNWKRDIGYAVPSICDHPGCNEVIDRGLGCVCGAESYGGDRGCGLFFCESHHKSAGIQLCDRCEPSAPSRRKKPYCAKPDLPMWTYFKMIAPSWEKWREDNGFTPEKLKKEGYDLDP